MDTDELKGSLSKENSIHNLTFPNIKVSIIMPVYNVEDYLRQCLDSIINQTLEEIEIICINDGSTDNSLQILEEYAKKDNRIIIINQKNSGSGVARNIGIKHVKGEYIGFVDSDDYIDITMFEKLYKNAKLNDTDIVMCPILIISENEEGLTNDDLKIFPYYNLDCFSNYFDNKIFDYKETRDFIFLVAVNAYNKIYRTTFIKKINAKFVEGLIFQDNIFFYQTYLKARSMSLIRDFLYFHRIHRTGSVQTDKGKGFYDYIKIQNMIIKIFESLPNFDDYKIELLNKKIIGIIFRYSLVSNKHRAEFFKLIKQDFKKMKLTNNELDVLPRQAKKYYLNVISSNSHIEFESRWDRIGKLENKISIIIPVYNAEKHIRQCLDSIINQSLREIEVICVNDASTDNSLNIIKLLSKKDKRIKYVSMIKNSGSGAARNKGIKLANAEYMSFVDSDDFIIDKTAYEKLYKFASQKNADIISANLKDYDNKKNTFKKNYFTEEIKDDSLILPQNYGIPWYFQKNLFKRQFLIENNIQFPNYKRGQDPVFLTNVLINVSAIYCLPIDFYAYRKSSSYKINSEEKEKDYIKHFRDVLELLKSSGFKEMYSEYEKRMYIFFKRQILNFSSKYLEKNISEVFGEKNEIMNISKFRDFLVKEKIIHDLESSDIKVSIIVPVYNIENYLRQCLDSIIHQTLKEIEIICINDGSTDNSTLILEEYALNDNRIKIINKENAGLGAARNTGIEHAKGEYIGFVDSDDYVDVAMFEKLYKNAKFFNSDIVMCPMLIVNEGGNELGNLSYYDLKCFDEGFDNCAFDYNKTKDFILRIAVNAYNKIYRSEFINRINAKFPEGSIFEDNPFFYHSYLNAKNLSLIRDFLYFHRVNRTGSIISDKDNRFFDIIKIQNLIIQNFMNLPNFEDYEKNLLNHKIINIIGRYLQVSNIYKPKFFEFIKEDFEKMDLKNNDIENLDLDAKNAYLNIINSNSYTEFELLKEKDNLINRINNLTNHNNQLIRSINKVNFDYNNLLKSNHKLYSDIDQLLKNNHKLDSDIDQLLKNNHKLDSDINRFLINNDRQKNS